jgi:hypothetical protein
MNAITEFVSKSALTLLVVIHVAALLDICHLAITVLISMSAIVIMEIVDKPALTLQAAITVGVI